MNIEETARNHLNAADSLSRQSADLLRELLHYRARETDNGIQNQLLKKLIFDYSEAERNLVELNNLKNKFLGIAAHDLRNPLTSIRGFCDILLEDEENLSNDQVEMLKIINEASVAMLGLVNDLLDVSVIESGRLELQLSKGSLATILEKRVKMSEVVATRKEIRLEISTEKVPDVSFDKNRIAQVIDNLIGNAVKFSPSGTTIRIACRKADNAVEFSVSDEGPGISEDDQAKLFGDFQRLSAQPTGGEKSTGLGLAIVKKVVDAHGGGIRVESELGKGTSFIVTLPAEK